MELKCIGGECDGEIVFVNDKLRSGDQVQVHKPLEFKLRDFSEEVSDVIAVLSHRQPKENIVRNVYLYRICTIHGTDTNCNKLVLKYLCPMGWHEWEAIQHQFGK